MVKANAFNSTIMDNKALWETSITKIKLNKTLLKTKIKLL